MIKRCANKIRKNAGVVMSATQGDEARNSIADSFINIAEALEKLDAPVESYIKRCCVQYALFGGSIGAVLVLIIISILK